jgi:hypothetical protein
MATPMREEWEEKKIRGSEGNEQFHEVFYYIT